MIAAAQPKVLQHRTQTAPQRRFWLSPAKYRCFVGGVGSGKTRAGCVEVLRMPAGSTGMVLAPTYPMLRDATLRTFLSLVERAGILDSYNKAEMVVTLTDGKTILFRSADNPDRLRGPNLGWFWLDEAALMNHEAWLIMLGRLREHPGLAWVTTTPRGLNWLHDVFTNGGDDHVIIRSSSRDNTFLPRDFVASLEQAYTTEFARQEIEGEFIEAGGIVFRRDWWQRYTPATLPAMARIEQYIDSGFKEGVSNDPSAIVTWGTDGKGNYYVLDAWNEKREYPDLIRAIHTQHAKHSTGTTPIAIIIEDKASGQSALQTLRRPFAQLDGTILPALPVIPFPQPGNAQQKALAQQSKVARAEGVTALIESGRVFLPERAPWVDAFITEHERFPLGPHDEFVDCTSMALARLPRAGVRAY